MTGRTVRQVISDPRFESLRQQADAAFERAERGRTLEESYAAFKEGMQFLSEINRLETQPAPGGEGRGA